MSAQISSILSLNPSRGQRAHHVVSSVLPTSENPGTAALPFRQNQGVGGRILDDEKSEGQESEWTASKSYVSDDDDEVFPMEAMWPMMFPYHEPTGISVCGGSHTVVSGVSNDHTAASASIVSADNNNNTEEGVLDLAQQLQDLHTRQLLDELQIRELYQDCDTEETVAAAAVERELEAARRKLKTFRGDDSELAVVHETIARMASSVGQHFSAKTAFHKAIKLRTNVHGRCHTAVANLLLELGDFLYNSGDYQDAVDPYIEALDIYQKLFGDKHTMVGRSYYKMGCSVLHQGFPDQAIDFLQESVKIQRNLSGSNAPELGDTLEAIGCAQVKCGRLIEAHESFEESLRIKRRQADRINVASTLKHLFNIYQTIKEYELAMDYLEEWLVIMGDLYSSLRQQDGAVKFYREALTIRWSLLEANRPPCLQAGDKLFKNGKNGAALERYVQFLQFSQDNGGGRPKECLYALLLSGNCYYLLGKVDESKRCFYDAAEIQQDEVKFCGNGIFTVQDVVFRLIREVNNASRFGKMLERVKWMAKDVGIKTKPSGISRSSGWQTWLGSKAQPNAH